MNDECHSNSNQQQGNASDNCNRDEGRVLVPMNLQPTPINPDKIVPVERVSIQATQWNLDNKSIEYLKGLSVPKASKSAEIGSSHQAASTSPKKAASASSTEAKGSRSYHDASTLLRQTQVDQWNARYAELVEFRKEHGHCLVPLRYQSNRSLSNWVKRQRYQYRIKSEGKHSTLNEVRQAALEKLGFVWDSHSLTWEERFHELSEFRQVHGHANVPKSYKQNQQLAVWVKSQRRHFRLHCNGKPSAMTEERMERLKSLGFVFNPRSLSLETSS